MIIDSHVHICAPPYRRARWAVTLPDGTEIVLPYGEDTGSKTESHLKLIDGLGLSVAEREKVVGGNMLRALGG